MKRQVFPYYLARVEVSQESLQELGDLSLVPGMPAEVFIATGARTFLQYVFKPLTNAFCARPPGRLRDDNFKKGSKTRCTNFRFLLFSLTSVIAAQPIQALVLRNFFSAAIKFNPTLQIASENLNISSARRKAAIGQLLPQISAGANISDNNAEQFNRTQDFTGERYFFGLSQTLFNWQQFALENKPTC